jgi:NAD(P)-dependent dehydrogenase (short-subunit alcohol dehydrogenase family)
MGGSYSVPDKKSLHYDALMESLPSMQGKVVVITGTTSGTGFVAARSAASKGAEVILLNRKSERSEKALEELKAAVPEATVTQLECDLMDFDSVRNATAEIKSKYNKIDVLCNNAGVMALEDKATKDGYDVQMQTNHLSHFLLTKELYPLLEKADDPRVVNHTSISRFGSKLQGKYLGKNGGHLGGNSSFLFQGARWERYHQTKLANGLFTYALKAKVEKSGGKVKALLAHPGVAATNLQSTTAQDGGMGGMFTNQFMRFSQSLEDGACGIVRGICDADAVSGDFYGPGGGKTSFSGPAVKIPPDAFLLKPDQQALLWTESEKAVGEFTI